MSSRTIRHKKSWKLLLLILGLCSVGFFTWYRREPQTKLPDWDTVFGGIRTVSIPESVPTINRVEVLIGTNGIPEMIQHVDQYGFDDGWMLKFTVDRLFESDPCQVQLEEARQIVNGEYQGIFFRWEKFGGGLAPASYGRWQSGRPYWGKFLVMKKPPLSLSGVGMSGMMQSDEYVEQGFGDTQGSFTYFRGGEPVESISSDVDAMKLEAHMRTEMEADPAFAKAASEIRSIAEEYLRYRLCRNGR